MGPKSTGKPPENVVLTDLLFPWEDGHPVFLNMPDSEYLYLPCFSTEEELRNVFEKAEITFESIKQIEDGSTFLSNFANNPEVKVIVDLHYISESCLRFRQVYNPFSPIGEA